MICESARVWVGLGPDSDRRFLASVQDSFCNFLHFLWSIQRHKQQLGLLIIQHEIADVTYVLVSHRACSGFDSKNEIRLQGIG